MDTNYTESEIRQKIDEYKKERSELKEKSTNPFVSWWAILVYLLLVLLLLEFGLRLWRLPGGFGIPIVILFILGKWGLPQMGKLIKAHNQLKKINREKEKEIAKLHQMLENVMKK